MKKQQIRVGQKIKLEDEHRLAIVSETHHNQNGELMYAMVIVPPGKIRKITDA